MTRRLLLRLLGALALVRPQLAEAARGHPCTARGCRYVAGGRCTHWSQPCG